MRSFDVSNDRLGMLHGLTQNDAPSPPLTRASVQPEASRPPLNPQSSLPLPIGNGNGGESSHTTALEDHRDTEGKRCKFRFKKKKHRSGCAEDEGRGGHHHRRYHRDHGREGSRRPSKRRRHSHERGKFKNVASTYDDTYLPNVSSAKYADPDEAFRQSLFDAMADDEGAAFWEGVYGEPINIYPRPEVKDERGMLEKMGDDEYAGYVRRKMWENSHQHIIEERERREREKEERKKKDREEQAAWEHAEKEILREGGKRRQRRKRSEFQKRWDEYLEDWSRIMEETRTDVDDSSRDRRKGSANAIPWPIKSGKLSDISQDAVSQFFLSAPTSVELSNEGFTDMLKLERIRWHPDKAQQRWGKFGLDEEEMKGITTIFQAIDALWIKHREKQVSG